jgi:1,2-diacylglycerol 3-beta-glucosyltransferase
MALIPDMLWGIFLTHHSVLWPISAVMVSMSIFALWGGLQHIHALKGWHLWKSTLLGLIYMMHWFPVMIFTTARMCVQPKRLKWIKTVHQGGAHS